MIVTDMPAEQKGMRRKNVSLSLSSESHARRSDCKKSLLCLAQTVDAT